MPAASEIAVNRALSGEELKVVLRAAFEKLLDAEGMLSSHVAFGRVAYDLTIRLHLDNPFYPQSITRVESRQASKQEVATDPRLAVIEPPPLDKPHSSPTVAGQTVSQSIESPNAERLRHGIPVPVDVRQQDGTVTTEHIQYPAGMENDVPENIVLTDTTRTAKADWGLLDEPVGAEPPAPRLDLSIQCKCGHPRGRHALSGVCTVCNDTAICPDLTPSDRPDAPANQTWPVEPT